MQVMDIISRATRKSGVIPSFNKDEIPEEYLEVASDMLRNELVISMNSDRVLDMTQIAYPATPDGEGVVELVSLPPDYGHKTYTVPMSFQKLMGETYEYQSHTTPANIWRCLIALGLVYDTDQFETAQKTDRWPSDQFGNPRDVALWTTDYKLVRVYADFQKDWDTDDLYDPRFNLPFQHTYVLKVVRQSTGERLEPVDIGEFVSKEFRGNPFIWAMEEYPDRLRIRVPRGTSHPLFLILPVPISVVNTFDEPDPWEGTIVAPLKFQPFLIAALAYMMADFYSVATKDTRLAEMEKAYTKIAKATSIRHHEVDVRERIGRYIGQGSVRMGGVGPVGGNYYG